MTVDFGKGFIATSLKNMCQFYLTFLKSYALRSKLSWTHDRLPMLAENEKARHFYSEESIKPNRSTLQPER